MAIVSGTLSDFGLTPLAGFQPTIIFTPSGVGVSGTRLLATRPIQVTPNPDGQFQLDLMSTDDITPATWYEVQIRWLEPSGGYSHIDFVDWKLFVPAAGGPLGNLLRAPSNNQLLVIWQATEPNPWPVGVVWANTTTGDLLRKDS